MCREEDEAGCSSIDINLFNVPEHISHLNNLAGRGMWQLSLPAPRLCSDAVSDNLGDWLAPDRS